MTRSRQLVVFLLWMVTAGVSGSAQPLSEPRRPGGRLDIEEQTGTTLVELTLSETAGMRRTAEPVTVGIPLPRAADLCDAEALTMVDASGRAVPLQVTVLARWGCQVADSTCPIRWALLDFQADVEAGSSAVYRVVTGGQPASPPRLLVSETANEVRVDTGAAVFSVSKLDGRLSAPHLAAPLFGRARDESGGAFTTSGAVEVSVPLPGPLRAAVEVRGSYRSAEGARLLDYTSRLWFFAGQPFVRLFHTVENSTPCPLEAEGQLACYHIGDGGGVQLTDLSLVMATQLGSGLAFAAGGEGQPVEGNLTGDLLLYQDSSGSDSWDRYTTLTDWDGSPLDARPRMQAYVSFRGFRATLAGAQLASGDHAAGWLTLTGPQGAFTVSVRDFWQSFPKALRAGADGVLEVGLFPDEFGPTEYAFTLRAGEHKTHEVLLNPWSQRPAPPLVARAPAEWYVASGALGLVALPAREEWPEHEAYVDHQLSTAPTYEEWMSWYPNLLAAVERTDFYGIFDYGDVPIDYEGYGVAPLNLKYNMDYGMWLQWLRGGDERWFQLAEAASRHIADIDVLHGVHSPRHWGDGVFFGHSYHDEAGFTNPHRNEGGNHPDLMFGIPGLLTAYYLTGYDKARETALEIAECIEYRLRNDVNLCPYFPDCSGEGWALGAGLYDDGTRPAANALRLATAAYRGFADPRYLEVADALVDWAAAANQPYADGPDGSEHFVGPWTLGMYLLSVAEYLEAKEEAGLADTSHGRDSLLAYATFLHTWPWLDLDPIDSGPRAAFPHEWWLNQPATNQEPEYTNWLLLGADAMAYAHHLTDEAQYLEWGARLFRTGSHDPWYEDDVNTYSSTKETANSLVWGHLFLHEWAQDKAGQRQR